MTQKYDKEFKLNAIKVYLNNSKSIEEIAQDLGISRASLGHWIKQYKREGYISFPGSGHVIEEELKSLKRELYLVRQEIYIKKSLLGFKRSTQQLSYFI